MSYTSIDPDTIKVGDPITKELWDIIKNNFDDIDSRLTSSATTGGSIHVFNGDIVFKNFNGAVDPSVFYFKVPQNCILTEVRAQLMGKQGLTSGTLGLDVKKATDTNSAGFNTVLSTPLTFNFATDSDYAEKTATINSSVSGLVATNVIRVEVTSLPAKFTGKILLYLGAE